MADQTHYAAAHNVPLIKSPSLRIPKPVELPPDIHPLPDSVIAYFVYPFTLEPHVLTLESSRRSTLASHTARHEAYLRQREEEKQRRKRDALRRIAPGFEPDSGPLVPTRMSTVLAESNVNPHAIEPVGAESGSAERAATALRGASHVRARSVMDDLVDHLAALDAASSGSSSRT